MSIEADTPLIPYIVAESVIEKTRLIDRGEPLFDAAVRYLMNYADTVYAHNKNWAKKIRGAGGREFLYAFMEHWFAAFLKDNAPEMFKKLPRGYGWGRKG